MPSLSRQLAKWVVGLRYADPPSEVRATAEKSRDGRFGVEGSWKESGGVPLSEDVHFHVAESRVARVSQSREKGKGCSL